MSCKLVVASLAALTPDEPCQCKTANSHRVIMRGA
jgi:hypothetical protein